MAAGSYFLAFENLFCQLEIFGVFNSITNLVVQAVDAFLLGPLKVPV
jgi:hypothetical protein